MTHPQLDALRNSLEAFANGDLEGFFAIFHDDFVVHVPGRSSFAGDYTGRDAFLSLMGQFMERYSETGSEFFASFADDEYGIVLERSTAARGGSTFEQLLASVVRFRDGKVSEMWSVPFDQAARDEWMA